MIQVIIRRKASTHASILYSAGKAPPEDLARQIWSELIQLISHYLSSPGEPSAGVSHPYNRSWPLSTGRTRHTARSRTSGE